MNKISSLKIAITFAAIIVAAYFGYQFYAAKMIDSKVFSEIEPGKMTLLGIDTGGSGYKIIVSNEIAQLVQSPNGKFEESGEAMGEEESTDKHRIPLREMVQSLQGNANALSELVTQMNDDLRKAREDIPPNPVIWNAADIQKAIDGDKPLESKLEHDLNAKLDGTPSDFINVNALYTGITVDVPVPVKVDVKGRTETLIAHVRFPYRVAFTKKVETDLQDKALNPSNDTIKGYYLQEASVLARDPNRRENVKNALQAIYGPALLKTYSDAAERVLSKTKVILNEDLVKDATIDQDTDSTGKPLYSLNLSLTAEGRDRLWQYSRHQVGTQLLLVVNGVAIAAPFIRHELAQSDVTITQMSDKDLVDEAKNTIMAAKK